MVKKTTHKTTKAPRKQTGEKGGVGVLTPETIGAMAGAAIGGVAGMMIGNRRSKGKLATVKEGATTALKSAANVLESESTGKEKPRKK